MTGDRTLQIERTFRASVERVFDAFTNEEVMRRWWHANPNWETPEATVDLRQSSDKHEAVVAELLKVARIEADYCALKEFTVWIPAWDEVVRGILRPAPSVPGPPLAVRQRVWTAGRPDTSMIRITASTRRSHERNRCRAGVEQNESR